MRRLHFVVLVAAAAPGVFAAQPGGVQGGPQAPAAAQIGAPPGQIAAPAGQAAAPQAPAAQPLGRLFFSREERAALDESRHRPVVVAKPEPKRLPPAPEYVTLNGVVRRSDGTTAVWLNNRLIEGRRTGDGLVVTPSKRAPGPANVTVQVPQAGRSVDLRVGQRLDVTSGKVQERYQVAPPPAPAGEPAPAAETPNAQSRTPPRRVSRDRELLRELLRDIERPPAERGEPPAPAKG